MGDGLVYACHKEDSSGVRSTNLELITSYNENHAKKRDLQQANAEHPDSLMDITEQQQAEYHHRHAAEQQYDFPWHSQQQYHRWHHDNQWLETKMRKMRKKGLALLLWSTRQQENEERNAIQCPGKRQPVLICRCNQGSNPYTQCRWCTPIRELLWWIPQIRLWKCFWQSSSHHSWWVLWGYVHCLLIHDIEINHETLHQAVHLNVIILHILNRSQYLYINISARYMLVTTRLSTKLSQTSLCR